MRLLSRTPLLAMALVALVATAPPASAAPSAAPPSDDSVLVSPDTVAAPSVAVIASEVAPRVVEGASVDLRCVGDTVGDCVPIAVDAIDVPTPALLSLAITPNRVELRRSERRRLHGGPAALGRLTAPPNVITAALERSTPLRN